MKKILLIICLVGSMQFAHGQVFNTASLLDKGQFMLGLNPVVYDNDFGMFFHAGYGINSRVDIGSRYGVLEGDDYFGVDLEWTLLRRPNLSLLTGIHTWGDLGFDLGANVSFPIKSVAEIYTGLDFDINTKWNQDETGFLFWIPVGLEVFLQRSTSLFLEAEIYMSDDAFNIFSGGVAFYL